MAECVGGWIAWRTIAPEVWRSCSWATPSSDASWLALQPLEALRDRVTMAFHRPPFTAAETADYPQHQPRHVGIDRPVFTETAFHAAQDWAQGRPRRINTWARACLLAAFVAQHPIVDDGVVATAQAELQWTHPVARVEEGGHTS